MFILIFYHKYLGKMFLRKNYELYTKLHSKFVVLCSLYFVELLSYRQHTQLIMGVICIFMTIVILRLVSES
jgi:hypothetical protein